MSNADRASFRDFLDAKSLQATQLQARYPDYKFYSMRSMHWIGLRIEPIGPPLILTINELGALHIFTSSLVWGWGVGEFASSEISQTLRDFLEYLNRSNTFCTNLKAQIILLPTLHDFLEYLNRSNTFCMNLKAQIKLGPYASIPNLQSSN